jgi:uncharacterized cupin superfamily protein
MNDKIKIEFATSDVALSSCPIRPEWIVEGAPIARNAVLSRSADGGACTLIWDCTAGLFNWRYDIDETVYVIEGGVVVRDDAGIERRLGPGDTAFFPAGSHAVWRVESYVRKVAFCRNPVPAPVMLAMRVVRKLARMAGLGAKSQGAPAMFGVSG